MNEKIKKKYVQSGFGNTVIRRRGEIKSAGYKAHFEDARTKGDPSHPCQSAALHKATTGPVCFIMVNKSPIKVMGTKM